MTKLFAMVKSRQKDFFARVEKSGLLKEAAGLAFILIAGITLLSLISFDPKDSSFFTNAVNSVTSNMGGKLGAALASMLMFSFGFASYILSAAMIWIGIKKFLMDSKDGVFTFSAAVFIAVVSVAVFCDRALPSEHIYYRGGALGNIVSKATEKALGRAGSSLLFLFLLLTDTAFIFNISFKDKFHEFGKLAAVVGAKLREFFTSLKAEQAEKVEKEEKPKAANVKSAAAKEEPEQNHAAEKKEYSQEEENMKKKKSRPRKSRVINKGQTPIVDKKRIGPLGQKTLPIVEKVLVTEYILEEEYSEDDEKVAHREPAAASRRFADKDEPPSKEDFSPFKIRMDEADYDEAEDGFFPSDEKETFDEEPEVKLPESYEEESPSAGDFGIVIPEAKAPESPPWDEADDMQPEEGIAAYEESPVTPPEEGAFENEYEEMNEEVDSFNKADPLDNQKKTPAYVSFIQSNYTAAEVDRAYKGAPMELLKRSIPINEANAEEEIRATAAKLEKTLSDFSVEARVVGVSKGPVITRYELEIAAGTKVSKIVSLTDNIALALASESVRILAPIPGRSVIGIEIPNKTRSMVCLRDVLESKAYKNSNMDIPVVIGKGIYGNNVVFDMAKAPHLLVAGTTGSGKSVCLSTLILSMVYAHRPDDLKFIFIDKKRVELSIYNGIPHLMAPVVSDEKKATVVLRHVVDIMEKRYAKMEKFYVRTVKAYNEKVRALMDAGESEFEGEALELFPYIIVVLDELYNLMVVASKEVEDLISRLAGMSRAVGIHLVIATQRPSADVVTGVIKANLPTRIAFQVPNKSNSRIILDLGGAEKLLGKGDALFSSPYAQFPERVQGSFVSDAEVKSVVDELSSQLKPCYDDELIEMLEREEGESGDYSEGSDDDMWEEAVSVVVNTRKASASFLQRRLKIGYNRAARIIEIMEQRGIIGPENGSKPREVLIGDYDA